MTLSRSPEWLLPSIRTSLASFSRVRGFISRSLPPAQRHESHTQQVKAVAFGLRSDAGATAKFLDRIDKLHRQHSALTFSPAPRRITAVARLHFDPGAGCRL